ncbi:MAG: aminopeptidase P family N-terminal domain-containing protein, partial [Pseudomonadota bacterium]
MLRKNDRDQIFRRPNGARAPLPFSAAEYERRIAALRAIMAERGLSAALLTSMHNIAYYTGFLYCSFGRPYGCVVTESGCAVISANIDGGQPWRRSWCDNLIYADWRRDNFQRAAADLIGSAPRLGIEGDHLTLSARDALLATLGAVELVDLAPGRALDYETATSHSITIQSSDG